MLLQTFQTALRCSTVHAGCLLQLSRGVYRAASCTGQGFAAHNESRLPPGPNSGRSYGDSSSAISSLERGMTEVARCANKYTSCPEHSKFVLEKVHELLGGHWLYVECANWDVGQPLAGQRARGLLHVCMCVLHPPVPQPQLTQADLPASSSSGPGGMEAEITKLAAEYKIQALREPKPAHELPMGSQGVVTYGVFKLDSNGWPNGQCYSAASVFEGKTTKRRNKKVESSFKVVRDNRPEELPRTWYKYVLGQSSFRMEKPPKEAAWRVKHWYHHMLRLAGADIDEAADAATLALEARQQRAARTLPQPHTGEQEQQAPGSEPGHRSCCCAVSATP